MPVGDMHAQVTTGGLERERPIRKRKQADAAAEGYPPDRTGPLALRMENAVRIVVDEPADRADGDRVDRTRTAAVLPAICPPQSLDEDVVDAVGDAEER